MTAHESIDHLIKIKKVKITNQENGILRLKNEVDQLQNILQSNIGALEQLKKDVTELEDFRKTLTQVEEKA